MALLVLLLHLPTLALNATTTLIYPLYSSYKAVTSPHPSLADMEVWLVYWSVFACWTLLESLFGFLWSWVPFYYELRLLFHIWLVAPQTRGATYVYVNHLHPFLQGNQEGIDKWVEGVKAEVRGRVDGWLGGMWSASLGGATDSAAPAGAPTSGKDARHRPPGVGSAPAPPTAHNPAQANLSLLGNLVKTYAPVAIASARTFLDSKAPAPTTTAYSTPSSSSRQDALHRRRQLESQLAALDASGVPSSSSSSSSVSSGEDDVPVTVMGNPARRASGGGYGSLRTRPPEDDAHMAPVTVMSNPGRRGSAGGAAYGSLRNRVVSGKTVKAGAAMGESYDLLDQNDLAPLQSPAREAKRSWMPWSPKE